MELQKLCYARLGDKERGAGYQLAAASEGLENTAAARYFMQAASGVESVEGAEGRGVFFGGRTAYLARAVMGLDDTGTRVASLTSALVADGEQWRALLREYPSWLLRLEDSAFYGVRPQGAAPGHPERAACYPLPEAAKERPALPALLGGLGLDRESFHALLRAVCCCLLAEAEETLLVCLPPDCERTRFARDVMCCLYAAMPTALASQLSYRFGAKLPAWLVFGYRGERQSYANYIDLAPGAGTQPVKCVQPAATEFLDDLITATLDELLGASLEPGSGLLDRMNAFLDSLELFSGSEIAPAEGVRGNMQYPLLAAWLHASGLAAERAGDEKAYFRPGSETAAITMLVLASLLREGKSYGLAEPVMAALLACYTDKPFHENPSEHGVKLKAEAVNGAVEHARRVFSPGGAFERACARYLLAAPRTDEGREANVRRLVESKEERDKDLFLLMLRTPETEGAPPSDERREELLRYYLKSASVQAGTAALKRTEAAGLNEEARQRLLEQLLTHPDADQKAVLNDSDLMKNLSPEIKRALFVKAEAQNPDRLGELLKTSVYTGFPSAIKLSLLESIPREEILNAALEDKEVQKALRSGGEQESMDNSLSLKPIQDHLLEKLRSKVEKSASREDIIQFLKETEQKYSTLDLSALWNKFWKTLQPDDIVYSEAEFYKELRPTSDDEKNKYEAVSAACAVYCSIMPREEAHPSHSHSSRLSRNKKRSETPEALDAAGCEVLYSLATTGCLSEHDKKWGILSDSKRKELFQKLRNQTRTMLKENAQTLATSPELTLLALFGGKKKLGRLDLYRLAKWAHKNSVELNSEEWVTCVREPLSSKSLWRYYNKSFKSKRTIRILVCTAILLLVTGFAALTYLYAPALYESYRIWKPHNERESITVWLSYETKNLKDPLPEPLAAALKEGNETGVFDFSGQEIDNELLKRLASGMELDKATELVLSNNQISDLTPLSSLTGLVTLELSNNQISDLTPLSSLTGLVTLELNGNQISDLKALKTLPNLKTLRLNGNQIAGLKALSSLAGLVTLELNGNPLRNLKPLAGLSGLTELRLLNCASVTSLDALAGLPKLKTLEAGGTGISLRELYKFAFSHSECDVYAEGKPLVRVYDTDGTPYLPDDPVLNLSGQTAALPHFADNPELFDGLRVLDLSNAGLDDDQLAQVQTLGKGLGDRLRLLILIGNPKLSAEAVDSLRNSLPECEILASEEPASVENEADSLHWDGDFTELLAQAAEQPALYALDLSQCKGKIDLAALAKAFPHLRALNLSGLELDNLTGIDSLTELEWLNLSGNKLSALKELYETGGCTLKNLKWLNISANPSLKTIQELRNYSSLQVLYASELYEEEPITIHTSQPKLQSLVYLSASDRFALEQIDDYLSTLKVLELRPAREEERALRYDESPRSAQFPKLVKNNCLILVGSYE